MLIYKENTMNAYSNWNAISLTPVNHAFILSPKPHVSFNTSRMQKTHQPTKASIMMFARLVKFVSFRSIIAIAINTNSNNSFISDTGIPGNKFSLAKNEMK